MPITAEMIAGKTEVHLSTLSDGHCQLHSEVVEPWLELQQAAGKAGFDLQIASSFRSFERQLAIWNAKACGARPVLDDSCQALELAQMDDLSKAFAILRWSALPGASRHHWGTDIDVWDAASVPENYSLQLVPEEYQSGGPFFGLSEWLGSQAQNFGFYRPYAQDCGGVAPELWHLSYRPVAQQFEAQLSQTWLGELLADNEIQLKSAVLDNLDEIYKRFLVLN